MRVYLPATLQDLAAAALEPARVHGVTPALRRELSEDDDEMLELVAFLAAADDSVRLVSERGDRPLRIVIAADVPDPELGPAGEQEIETALAPRLPIRWELVAAVHADEEAAEGEVAAAAGGDEAAYERLGERELLWYDAAELDQLRAQLGV
nr:hypothetical protein [Actinomycetales bacterium]